MHKTNTHTQTHTHSPHIRKCHTHTHTHTDSYMINPFTQSYAIHIHTRTHTINPFDVKGWIGKYNGVAFMATDRVVSAIIFSPSHGYSGKWWSRDTLCNTTGINIRILCTIMPELAYLEIEALNQNGYRRHANHFGLWMARVSTRCILKSNYALIY